MWFGSKSADDCDCWASSCGGRDAVFERAGSLLERRLRRPNSSVDDVSKIKSCSCSTLRGFVGVWGFVEKAGSSLKCVMVGSRRSEECSSSIPTKVSVDELECCACCSIKERPICDCENSMSEKDVSKLWSDCCCWLMSSSCCCCCCNNK